MISVILPVYQVEKYIVNCLKSLINQSYVNFEIIIVNDGTKDNSIILADNFLKKTSLNYIIINQKNMGVSSARNNGIRYSKGDWVVCIDPDDILDRDFLKNLIEANNENNTIVSIGSYQMVNETNLFKKSDKALKISVYMQNQILHEFLLRKIKIISPAVLVKKELLLEKNIWFNEDMRFSEDVHWIWKLLFHIDKVSYVHREIYNYNERPNSTMTSSSISKIMTGYYGFKEMNKQIVNSNFSYYNNIIFDRWIFGALRASAKILEYKEFKEICYQMSYKEHAMRLITFPDIRVKIMSILLRYNRRLFYIVGKRF